ncbi:MAG: putative metalloprotease CJM1_0395 family protein [Planctomycetota bacterium]
MSVSATTLAVSQPMLALYAATAETVQAQAAARIRNAESNPETVPQPNFKSSSTDVLELSREAVARLDESQTGSTASPSQSTSKTQASGELTEEQQAQVDQLKQRDREVRTHEQAHKSAAGPYAVGGPTYEYQRGPDGRNYAVGGSVQIDTAPVEGDPEATIRKMQVVRAAALAPAEPSSQDRKVAAAATRAQSQARAELAAADDEKPTATDAASGINQSNDGANGSRNPAKQYQDTVAAVAGQLLNLIA